MPTSHPCPWRSGSLFGTGRRRHLDRDQRARFRYLLRAHARAGRLPPKGEWVGAALLKRLGDTGQCDPSHETLATDAGCSSRTVPAALRPSWHPLGCYVGRRDWCGPGGGLSRPATPTSWCRPGKTLTFPPANRLAVKPKERLFLLVRAKVQMIGGGGTETGNSRSYVRRTSKKGKIADKTELQLDGGSSIRIIRYAANSGL